MLSVRRGTSAKIHEPLQIAPGSEAIWRGTGITFLTPTVPLRSGDRVR